MKAVFIGGAPRSGTTLAGTLLQCIPGSCVTPESRFRFGARWDDYETSQQYGLALSKTRLFRKESWRVEEINEICATSEREFFEKFVSLYNGGMPRYWIDHTPANMEKFAMTRSVFPDAKFIHVIRDGRAVANSVIPLEWGPNTPGASARFWAQHVAVGLANHAMHPDSVMNLRYEDIVEDHVSAVNSVLKFLEVDLVIRNESELNYNGAFLPAAMRVGQHKNIGRKPDKALASSWMKKLAREDIVEFEYYAGHLLKALGYPLLYPDDRPRRVSLLKHAIVERWRKRVTNPPKYRKIRGIS